MHSRISLSLSGRLIYAVVLLLTGLFLFTLATGERITTVGAAGFPGLVTVDANIPTRLSSFDAETNIFAPASARRECATAADVRWQPRSSVNISYAQGDFSKDERVAFHRAVTLWQRALSEMGLGIVLEERGEIDKEAKPAPWQIIVKRDASMDSSHYGKIVASTRPDNYLDRAFILINGSLRKRSSLRKTMLHELGHAFGLRDCPNCPSGATVMNYFSQQLFMGFKIRTAGGKISGKPTACDIAEVARGYRQSLPAWATNEAEEWERERSRTLLVDETVGVLSAKRGDKDNNIIAPYLTPKAAIAINESAIAPSFKTTVTHKVYEFGMTPYFEPTAAEKDFGFRFAPYLKPASADEAFKLVIPRYRAPSANNAGSAPEANTLTIDSHPVAAATTEANMVSIGSRNQHILTDVEKIEFESYIPTLLGKEAETMGELNNYTFTRDLRIQTIDSKGRVSGEYRRTSEILFDDSGGRIERGLSLSKSTLRRLKISPEYVENFWGVQLKGFELSKRDHYRIEPFMSDKIDGISMRVYRMTPLNLNAERAAYARVFYGYVWIEENTGRIVKLGGCALPEGKQRYPLFETQRALIDGKHLFPVHTIADDYLVFSSHTVHVRMLITYSNYKRFDSRVKIVEVDS